MSNATPLFLITDAGLAAASVATPTGPYIHITGFEIGSAYGYTPTEEDTGIDGNLLYTGVPTSYEYIGNNTLNIICEIPPDAGPWQFGEVALFLPGNVMFAKAVFSSPQTKFSSLGTNVVSSYTFNCLLKLQQSVAVFQIDTIGPPPACVDIYQWSDVYPPGISANPDVPLYLVRELSDRGDSSLLQNTSDAAWTLGSTSYNTYSPAGTNNEYFTVTNSSTSWIQVAASACHPADLGTPNRRFVIQTPDGFYRSVSSVVTSGSNYQFNLNVTNDGTYNNSPLLNAPAIGSHVRIYRDDQAGGSIYYSQIIDPPAPPALATVGTPGLAYGSTGLYMPNAGVIQAYGILQSPGANTGRELTGSDNLNNTNWPSGLFICYSGAGYPANMPVSVDGHIWMHAENPLSYTQGGNANSLTQIFYPAGGGGGNSVGVGGYPPYWREWNASVSNGQGGWSNWFPLSVSGKQGQSGGVTTAVTTISNGYSATVPSRCEIHIWVNDGSPSNSTSLSKNGQVISQNSKGGSAGYGRWHHDHGLFGSGDTISYSTTGGVGSPIFMATHTF
jgi:hypothetical protein